MGALEIIIPVYNEGETVKIVYKKICNALGNKIQWKALFIYDFDEDTSKPFLEQLQQQDSRVIPLRQNYGRGVINALKFGIHNSHNGAIIVAMGDDSDDLGTLEKMLEAFDQGATVVSSSRHMKGGYYKGGNHIKHLLSLIAGKLLYAMGIGTCDPTNNFKLYDGKYLKQIEIESVGGFEFALEIVVKASLNGKLVTEIPGSWHDRTSGESKFKLLKWLPHYLKWFLYYFIKKIVTAHTCKAL